MKDLLHDTAFGDIETVPSAPRASLYLSGFKRFFDVAVIVFILPILIPLLFVLWLMVRTDGGPGFYCQPRIGRDGTPFKFWKLRTMILDAESTLHRMCADDPALAREWARDQKLCHDPRITPLGRFLRATSLDELPQALNVLRGEMSLVGPRPFMAEQARLYSAAGGRAYFALRPGITGLWQIYGRGRTSFADRVHFDEAYYDGLGLLFDCRLILLTLGVIFGRTGQ